MKEENIKKFVDMSYTYFNNLNVDSGAIKDFIKRMKAAFPDEEIDEEELFLRLESAHIVSMSTNMTSLNNKADHEDWFNVSTNRPLKRDFEWKLWEDLKTYLITRKSFNTALVKSLDKLSSEIIRLIEDPTRTGSWVRRGMVMGSVQSGKTANYTAVICKALDAGYKMVIVLAGIHNSLRSQTQERLNGELLGYDLDRVQRITGSEPRIGVGLFSNHSLVNTLTSSNEQGDFKHRIASQAGIVPSPTGDPIVLIIKKNVPVLKNLLKWLSSLPISTRSQDMELIQDIPLLVIDDECDLASVNTRKPEYDENGDILEDWDPAKTNMYIRKILRKFSKKVYIGYTATPYANIFIYKDDIHPIYGEDLFPNHFITSLPQPSNYIGPEKLFGLPGDASKNIEQIDPLPLVREIDDHADVIPDLHKINLQIPQLPPSMVEAIRGFILVCAARRVRQKGIPHNSMLIHVTRYTAVQEQVLELVSEVLSNMIARIQSGSDSLDDFRTVWESDFIETTRKMETFGFSEKEISWEIVKKELYKAAIYIKIKAINGTSRDILEYREHESKVREKEKSGEIVPWSEKGIYVIAIGGDKLSRGLTLDGLSISYYLRASKMYDTLMQMGRWFGYREGYTDLCRIYTTAELATWYSHIALANEELRHQLEYMAAINSSPEQFGLRVRSHPGRLAVTSVGKSRAAEKISIAYAGTVSQTIVFDPRCSSSNRKALERLIESIGRECDRQVEPRKPRYQWDRVDSELVIDFLQSYKTQDIAKKVVDPEKIAQFIGLQNKNMELREWTVVLVSTPCNDAVHTFDIGKYKIGCCKRSPTGNVREDLISIGTLTSPADLGLDLSDQECKKASDFDMQKGSARSDGELSSAAIRFARPKTRGLLLIYFPSCNHSENPERSYGLQGEEVVGFAVCCPESDTAVSIEYLAAPVHPEEIEIS